MAGPKIPATGFFHYRHGANGYSQYWLDGQKLLSMSQCAEAIGDGDGLQRWAADMERKSLLAAARDLYGKCLTSAREAAARGGTIEAMPSDVVFGAQLEHAVGRAFAYATYRDEAADLGKYVHSLLEAWFKMRIVAPTEGKVALAVPEGVPDRDRIILAFNTAREFLEKEDIVPLAAERPVYSRELGVGGRLDKIALVRGVPAVIDWKVTKSIRYKARFTTSGYRNLYNDCPEKLQGLDRIDVALVVRLPKVEGEKIELHALSKAECDEHRATLEHVAHLRRALNARGVFDRYKKS